MNKGFFRNYKLFKGSSDFAFYYYMNYIITIRKIIFNLTHIQIRLRCLRELKGNIMSHSII